jgi:hypothetical protein
LVPDSNGVLPDTPAPFWNATNPIPAWCWEKLCATHT